MPIGRAEYGHDTDRERSTSPLDHVRTSLPKNGADQRTPTSRQRVSEHHQTGQMHNGRISPTETRQELILRKKREQRDQFFAPWVQNSVATDDTRTSYSRNNLESLPSEPVSATDHPHPNNSFRTDFQKPIEQHLNHPSMIERPRSALHRGDFRQDSPTRLEDSPRPVLSRHRPPLSTFPTSPWFSHDLRSSQQQKPLEGFQSPVRDHSDEPFPTSCPLRPSTRIRATSYSAKRSSFEFRFPSSPLAIESRQDDFEKILGTRRASSPDQSARRHTFSPSLMSNSTTPPRRRMMQQHSVLNSDSSSTTPRAPASLKSEKTFPYQAHQPRRSISSLPDASPYSLPGTPSARSRRPSLASESSPLQRLPMIGRYEESILRGRMSSLPSKPLDFVASIGVMGKGKCKSSLVCPRHEVIPFPAVFYNYGSRPSSPMSAEGPSPYVGMIDLDEYFSNHRSHSARRSRRLRSKSPCSDVEQIESESAENGKSDKHLKPPTDFKRKERSKPQFSLPKGGYRIPQQGQLQIIIKNPNKTAVKLFLIPYDLAGMKSGQKTFIRQRSYSAGPIIDMPQDQRKNLGTDRPEAALSNSDDPKDRPMLRYLIHVNICCTAKGRFFLYKNVRVVFANRVPDGKEKLRNEIQLPEPRFSTYRPQSETRKSESLETQPEVSNDTHNAWEAKSHWLTLGNVQDGSFFTGTLPPALHRTSWDSVPPLGPAFTFPPNFCLEEEEQRFISRDRESDAAMHDQGVTEGILKRKSCISPSSSSSNNTMTEGRSSSRHNFERLRYEEMESSRPQSPQPGEGLLSMQIRGMDRDELMR